ITNDIRNGAGPSGGGGGDAIPHEIHGCPENFKTRLAAFKLEGDALSWWKAHLRTQVGGDAFADIVLGLLFVRSFTTGSLGQRRSSETLPPSPLCATCGKPHLGVCYKATGGCFTCGSTQHKGKDCPQGKQKLSMSTDLSRLHPQILLDYLLPQDGFMLRR
nr:zinc finger, CCHC-type, retrotransposon Gag domain protein [Tanacetum cinerariifolium]